MKIERPANGNFAAMVERHAAERPDKLALVVPKSWDASGITDAERLSFRELWHRVQQFMAGLERNGIGEGDRVLLAVPFCTDVYALALALFGRGVTAILVDASMGKRKVKRAVAASRAKAVVSVDALLKYRWLIGPIRRIPLKFSMDRARGRVRGLDQLAVEPDRVYETVPRRPDDEALITYTSGSTGQPKGADRNHRLLIEQVMTVPAMYEVADDHVNVPAFPVAALAGLCLGLTTVLPPMSFARPDAVDAAAVINEMRKWDVHNFSGPPIYMQRLAEYVLANRVDDFVPRQLGVGGAPVSRHLCRLLVDAFPRTERVVIYGSTEAEPMADIEAAEVLARDERAYPAGRPAPVATIALVDLPEPAPALDERSVEPYRVAQGKIGEVIVAGDHVNRRYVDDDAATAENKLFELDGRVWHRTGDLAYQDAEGLLWLVGRHSYAVERDGERVHPFPVEIALNQLPGVGRAALVATRKQPRGVVAVVAADPSSWDEVVDRVVARLAELGLADVPIRRIDAMPVDGRHNSKVDRVQLRSQLG